MSIPLRIVEWGDDCISGGGMQISVNPDEVIKVYGPNTHVFPIFMLFFMYPT